MNQWASERVSFRSSARDCFIPPFYPCVFIILYFSGSFLEAHPENGARASLFSALIFVSPLFLVNGRKMGKRGGGGEGRKGGSAEKAGGELRVCIRRIAMPRRDIRAAKLDRKGRHKLPGIPRRRSLVLPRRSTPKYAPAENSRDTPVMKLSRTLSPPLLSSSPIESFYYTRVRRTCIAIVTLKMYFQSRARFFRNARQTDRTSRVASSKRTSKFEIRRRDFSVFKCENGTLLSLLWLLNKVKKWESKIFLLDV